VSALAGSTAGNAAVRGVAGTAGRIGVAAGNGGAAMPLYIVPSAEPTGPNLKGALYVNSAGELYICTVAGTPGTWVKVGAQ